MLQKSLSLRVLACESQDHPAEEGAGGGEEGLRKRRHWFLGLALLSCITWDHFIFSSALI